MGKQTAHEIAELGLDIEQALGWHLQHNHYPPIPLTMVTPCIEAIELARLGYYTAQVTLPSGVTYHGEGSAPVSAIVENHHLEAFIGEEVED